MSEYFRSAKSSHPFAETVERLSATLEAAGNTLFATIDQAEAARKAGTDLRPTTLLLFGNPKAGTPLMAASPLAALDLPLRIVVWEQDGEVWVASPQMAPIAQRYGVTGFGELLAKMDGGLAALAASVA